MEPFKKLGAIVLGFGLGVALLWAGLFPPKGMWSGIGTEAEYSDWDGDPWQLWSAGPKLRGASLWQRRFTDSDQGIRDLSFGPPYSQAEFDQLANMGANLVNISHPGLFSENPPYLPDQEAIENLDDLIAKAAKAHLFVLISLRTGPGRKEEGFSSGLFELENHKVWVDAQAQDAWVEMWKMIALRYRDTPNVVGYGLMVEPNSSSVLLKIDDPKEFYPQYSNTNYDWNVLAKRLTGAIREVDAKTPILMGGMGWSNLEWLPYIVPTGDQRTVYVVHQWDPYEYTNLSYLRRSTYPTGNFNLYWLRNALKKIGDFKKQTKAPVMIGEYGVYRWQNGASDYLKDELKVFEELGLPSAVWLWESADPEVSQDVFDFRKGTVEDNHTDVIPNPLTEVLTAYWGKNYLKAEVESQASPFEK